MPKAIHEGYMVRYGRRKIGRSFVHKRYFMLEPKLLAYYKRKPSDNEVPIKTIIVDPNCRVEDRGLETHHGRRVFVLSVYNKKDKSTNITMAAFQYKEVCRWKEAIEQVIEQYPQLQAINGNSQLPQIEIKENTVHERTMSSSDGESLGHIALEDGAYLSFPQAYSFGNDLNNGLRKHWRLVRCQNGLRLFDEIPNDYTLQNHTRAMKAVGMVEAKCEEIFSLVMGMDETRNEWDSTFHSGSSVEEVNGHTAVLYHRLQLAWCSWLVWPRDVCYVRYWRRNDDGSYVVVFRSKEHPNCPPQPGCVRAHVESGGFIISPLKPRVGSEGPRSRVEHQMQIDLGGWGVGYLPFYQHQSLLQMLNSVAGLREWFAQSDDFRIPTQFNRIMKLEPKFAPARKGKRQQQSIHQTHSIGQTYGTGGGMQDFFPDDSDDEDDGQIMIQEAICDQPVKDTITSSAQEADELDLSAFPSTLVYNDHGKAQNCWSIPNGNHFRVRTKRFPCDRSKAPAGESLLQLVSVDWLKDRDRMDHLAQRKGCAAQVAAEKGHFTLLFNMQVPGPIHYSMVLYFVAKRPIPQGSLLSRFVDGDDGFRNSRLKLIPSVPMGSWIVRQSVGNTPCILGKAVDCNYYRGKKYLEVCVDIGSSTVANGVLGLVFGVISSLVVDMAFLVQGNSMEELPERLIGAVRISRLELSSAVSPGLKRD